MTADGIEAEARALAQRLAALPELDMRFDTLGRFLEAAEPEWAARVLAHIQRQARGGGPPFDVALLTVATALSEGRFDYERLTAIYGAARSLGLDALAPLFFTTAERRAKVASAQQEQRDLTLGHRKALGRSRDPDVLARLLADPEPPVVAVLLQNPRITELDVVRLTARRPTDPAVQRVVFASRRWNTRYGVRRALVLNPDTPLELSLRLVSLLLRDDLKLVLSMGTLPDPLRDAARIHLDQR